MSKFPGPASEVFLRMRTSFVRKEPFPIGVGNAANSRSLHPEASTHLQSRAWVSAPCVAFSGTTGALLSLCSVVKLTIPPSYPPFPQDAFAPHPSRGSPRSGTMGTLTPAPLTTPNAGLPAYLATPCCRSVSNHVGLPGHRLPPRQRDQRFSDFAIEEQAPRNTPAESSSFTYGPTFRLRLLPTSSRDDAVTFGYGVVACSDTDFHRADVARHGRSHSRESGKASLPGFRLALARASLAGMTRSALFGTRSTARTYVRGSAKLY
jgi:hypothetical protein